MKSVFPDIVSSALTESRDFYTDMFGFTVLFEIDWYIQLQNPEHPEMGLAFVSRDNDSVPGRFKVDPQGFFVSIEVDDVDELYAKAQERGHEVAVEIKSEEWGQRHFVIMDPNGLPVDVFTLIPPSAEFAAKHGLA